LTIGVDNAFIQEGDAAQESFIPDFDKNIIWFLWINDEIFIFISIYILFCVIIYLGG
jgi:hypothetical protein